MSLSKEVKPKPWSIAEFGLYRPNIKDFVDSKICNLIDNEDYDIRRILIHGDVKSGKREIVEYIAIRDKNSLQREHVFMSSFHRVSDNCQREELKNHNLIVYSIKNNEDVENAKKYILTRLNLRKKFIIHIDECDYGTGVKQNLKKIYSLFKNNTNVIFILYSATPEELLFSSDITQSEEDENFIREFYEEGIRLYYIPPDTYCGAKKFLDNDLVIDAKPFILLNDDNSVSLSQQAKELINEIKNYIHQAIEEREDASFYLRKFKKENNIIESEKYRKIAEKKIKNILTLRFTGKTGSKRSIELFAKNLHLFQELEDTFIIFDKVDYDEKKVVQHPLVTFEQVDWSKKAYWDLKNDNKLIIIVNELTSTRSTEWEFHDRVYATHDYRNSIVYGTIAQAQLRVAHYSSKYGSFQHIKVYGHLKTFQLAAKIIDVNNYLIHDWIKELVKRNRYFVNEKILYKEKKTWINATITAYDEVYDLYVVVFIKDDEIWEVKNIPIKELRLPEKKYQIRNKNSELIHHEFNGEYNNEEADEILVKLGCDKKVDLSSRVKGKCKLVLKIKSEFIKCDEGNINEKLNNLKTRSDLPENVKKHNFITNDLFNNFDIVDGIKIYKGKLRSIKDRYSFEFIKEQRWGFNENNQKPRITLCYDEDNNLGICLRYTTGEKEEINTLSSYFSMYQPINY